VLSEILATVFLKVITDVLDHFLSHTSQHGHFTELTNFHVEVLRVSIAVDEPDDFIEMVLFQFAEAQSSRVYFDQLASRLHFHAHCHPLHR